MVPKLISVAHVVITLFLHQSTAFRTSLYSRHNSISSRHQLQMMTSTMIPTKSKTQLISKKINHKTNQQDNYIDSSHQILPAINPYHLSTTFSNNCNSSNADFEVFINALNFYRSSVNKTGSSSSLTLDVPIGFRLTTTITGYTLDNILIHNDNDNDLYNNAPMTTTTNSTNMIMNKFQILNNDSNNITINYHYTEYPLGKIYRKVLNGVLFNTLPERTFLNSFFQLSIQPRKYSFETFITALICYKRKYCSHAEKLVIPRDFVVPMSNITTAPTTTATTTAAMKSSSSKDLNLYQGNQNDNNNDNNFIYDTYSNTSNSSNTNINNDNDNDWPEETRGLKLGLKVQFIRSRHLYNSTAQIGLLKSLGFVWEPQADRAQLLIRTLQTHQSIYGHLDIPKSFTVPVGDERFEKEAWGLKLGYSIGNIRYRGDYAAHTDAFTQLGLETAKIGVDTRHWEHIYSGLKIFKHIYGHLRVPVDFVIPSTASTSKNMTSNDIHKNDSSSDDNNNAIIILNDKNNNDNDTNNPHHHHHHHHQFVWPPELHNLKLGYRAKNIKYRGDFVSENEMYRKLLTDIGFEFQIKKKKKEVVKRGSTDIDSAPVATYATTTTTVLTRVDDDDNDDDDDEVDMTS